MNIEIKPLIFWEGFPSCGLIIKKIVEQYGDNIVVVATKPAVPFENLETFLGHNIIWFENANDIWLRRDEFNDRNFIIHTGWTHNGWLKYDKWIKKKNDAKIIVTVDNSFKKNARQFIGAIYFRIVLKKFFDMVFVPGRSGEQLMKFLGMPKDKIHLGMYGAYEGIYKDRTSIVERNNEFLYVGQLNKRKSIDILIAGFSKYKKNGGSWNLRILGSGHLEHLCKGDGIIFEGFTQPHEVVAKMNMAKVLLLISREDHWGTVVCEAAACGMHIITSKTVGASVDIVRSGINGIELATLNSECLAGEFKYFENMTEDVLLNGSEVSKGIAKGYDSSAYFASFMRMKLELEGHGFN